MRQWPTGKASAAELSPIARVPRPAHHQLMGDQWHLLEPIGKYTSAVMTVESWRLVGASTRNGSSGTAPHSPKDAKVLAHNVAIIEA